MPNVDFGGGDSGDSYRYRRRNPFAAQPLTDPSQTIPDPTASAGPTGTAPLTNPPSQSMRPPGNLGVGPGTLPAVPLGGPGPSPWGDLWSQSGQDPQKFVQAFIAKHNLVGHQTDPQAINQIVGALTSVGQKASLDQRTDQYHKGIMLDGKFVKLLDGSDRWIWDAGAGGEAGGAGGAGTTDPSTDLFVNEILSRLHQLHNPVDDQFRNLYALMALRRVNDLTTAAPYTAGEDAALRAHYLEPLTQARDTAMGQAREQIGARGMAPSSGLLQDLYSKINTGYERGVASGANDTALKAIDEKQRRNDEALMVLSDILSKNQGYRAEDTSNSNDILRIAAMLPAIDQDRVSMLLNASSDAPSTSGSLLSTLLGVGNQKLTADQIAAAQKQATAQGWGQFFGYFMNNLDKFQSLFG